MFMSLFFYAITMPMLQIELPEILFKRTMPGFVQCGEVPENILNCIGNPESKLQMTYPASCSQERTMCESVRCRFNHTGFLLTNGKVNTEKLSKIADQIAKDNPAWESALKHWKTDCLTKELKPQGVYTDCPVYDAAMCFLSSVIRYATPSQWSRSSDCDVARRYAALCPVCPSTCFATRVPYGSCNACLWRPRAP